MIIILYYNNINNIIINDHNIFVFALALIWIFDFDLARFGGGGGFFVFGE